MLYTTLEYKQMTEQPWGRIFYDIIFRQLNISDSPRMKILDFGAGFCITSDHYALNHDVIAYEPNADMYNLRCKSSKYVFISDLKSIREMPKESFDMVICHNVLEYAENKNECIDIISDLVKKNGIISIVKHNMLGKIFAQAVFEDSPENALAHFNNFSTQQNTIFGSRILFSNEELCRVMKKHRFDIINTYGIRAFYGLSSNNKLKYSEKWYKNMLELETKAGDIDEFKKVAFFNHLIFKKLS